MSKPCANKRKPDVGTSSLRHLTEGDFLRETARVLPAQFIVKIVSFSLLSKKYETREFSGGGYKWKLVIDPDNRECVHLRFVKTGTDGALASWGVNYAVFEILLYNQKSGNCLRFQRKLHRNFYTYPSCSIFPLITIKKTLLNPVEGYLVDDICIFGVNVFVPCMVDHLSLKPVVNPFKHDWVIEGLSKLKSFKVSEEFTANGHKWMVELYPNGHPLTNNENVALMLYVADSPKIKVNADFCICLKNKIKGDKSVYGSSWFSSRSGFVGWPAFLPIADMHDPGKGYFVNDCCRVEIEITVRAVSSCDEP